MITSELQPTAYTADKEFTLDPNYAYTFSLNGSGTWQVWDGVAWLTYAESTGTSQAFRALPPPTGRVNLNVSAGTVTAGFKKFQPEGRTRKGNN